ncbi:MAG: YraN family protein [Dehalococcoidia bacterium]|nr:YraN family protein [Dehalococcoidia bacterium]
MKTNARKKLGDFGESTAVKFLKDKGCEIVSTNYRCRYGEIDIVAKDDYQLVFVEVRTKKASLWHA